MPQPGRVVILNGAPRAGKSSLARAVQSLVPGGWINWGVDAFNATLSPGLLPGIGLRPGGERPDFEPVVVRLFTLYARTLSGFARDGFDVVADLGLHSDYAAAFDPRTLLFSHLQGLPVLFVGIDCDLPTIMARRNADPRGYLAGPDIPAPVLRWQHSVHANHVYDLRLDMGQLTPEQGAGLLAAHLADLPKFSA